MSTLSTKRFPSPDYVLFQNDKLNGSIAIFVVLKCIFLFMEQSLPTMKIKVTLKPTLTAITSAFVRRNSVYINSLNPIKLHFLCFLQLTLHFYLKRYIINGFDFFKKRFFFIQNDNIYIKEQEVSLVLQWANKMWFKFTYSENQT